MFHLKFHWCVFWGSAQFFVAVDCIIEPCLRTFWIFLIILNLFWSNIYCNCTTVQNIMSFTVFFGFGDTDIFLRFEDTDLVFWFEDTSLVFWFRDTIFLFLIWRHWSSCFWFGDTDLFVLYLETSIFTYCFWFWDTGRYHVTMDPEPYLIPCVGLPEMQHLHWEERRVQPHAVLQLQARVLLDVSGGLAHPRFRILRMLKVSRDLMNCYILNECFGCHHTKGWCF